MSSELFGALMVEKVIREQSAGVTLVLGAELAVSPGQFVMVWLPGVGERPFTVMNDRPLSITVARVGPFTRALCRLEPGQRVWVRGPYGHGFPLSGKRHLFVGGGSGVASLTLLAEQARARGVEAIAVVGASTTQCLMLLWRLRDLGCEVIVATDDGTCGYHGTAVDAAESLLVTGWPDHVYACGPEPMLIAIAERAEELGIECWVSLERAMKCGLGVCGTCHCGDRLVCKDGPVLSSETLLRCVHKRVEPRVQG